jgi:two-component system NarL family response regulator
MTSQAHCTVLVAHEDPIVSMGLAAALAQHEDFRVVSTHGGDVEASARAQGADVIVTDYHRGLGCVDGGERRRGDPRRVVIVTSRDRELDIRCALQLGIRGYMLLGTCLDEFLEGIRAVARGAHFLSRALTHKVASSLAHNALTRRESDVLRLLMEGHSNKRIANELGIATETAKCHVRSILDKVGASTRTQAAAIAMDRGLVRAPTSLGEFAPA